MKYCFLFILASFFFNSSAHAALLEDLGLCELPDGTIGPIQKLICDSHPALIEASNPGLKIPSCDSAPEARLVPETSAVASVFVSCAPKWLTSCQSIATEVLAKKTGATVNILVNQKDLRDGLVAETLKVIKEKANSVGSPLNIIPVASKVKKYMRDPAVIKREGNKSTYVSLPYSKPEMGTSIGLTQEIANQCGYKYENSYDELLGFDSAYNMIGQLNAECIDDQGTFPCEVSPAKNGQNHGGNFLAMPDGSVMVGKTDTRMPDPGIVNYFEKKQKVHAIDIPKLSVAHIDEVFRFIPSKDKCGFSILRASPVEMIKFLKTRPANELVYGDEKNNYAAEDFLKDETWIKNWEESEAVILKSTEKIKNILAASKPGCSPQVIALPVLWTPSGNPKIANPVNAMTVNGTYFYSAPYRYLNSNGTAKVSVYKPLDEYVRKKLQPKFSQPLVSVDTFDYDQGNGNFHCATTNVLLPCK